MRLLLDTPKQTLPLSVLVLARLIAQNKFYAPQGRGRGPPHFGIFPRPLVIQYALNGVDPYVLYTFYVGQSRFILMHQIASGTDYQYRDKLFCCYINF